MILTTFSSPILGSKILGDKGASSKPRVSESSSKTNKTQAIQDVVSLRMVVPIDLSFPKRPNSLILDQV